MKEKFDSILKKWGVKEYTDIEMFENVVCELFELFVRKNADYKGSQDESVADKMYKISGDNYFADLFIGKGLRIKSVSELENINNESIEDSYKDIANYAILALMCKRKVL